MANYLDTLDPGADYIDVSDDSQVLTTAVGGGGGGYSQDIVNASIMVGRTSLKTTKVRQDDHHALLILPLLLQHPVFRSVDDFPLLESLDRLLAVRIDPSDLKTCAFGKHPFNFNQNASQVAPLPLGPKTSNHVVAVCSPADSFAVGGGPFAFRSCSRTATLPGGGASPTATVGAVHPYGH